MKDIGGGGILFEANRMMDIGTILQLEIEPQDLFRYAPAFHEACGTLASEPIVLVAEVVRSVEIIAKEKYDIAAKFVNINGDDLRGVTEPL